MPRFTTPDLSKLTLPPCAPALARPATLLLTALLAALLASLLGPAASLAAGLADTPPVEPCPCQRTAVLQGGLVDEFAAPLDPPRRSAAMNALLPGHDWLSFDENALNRHIAHSFTLPPGVVAATLEVRMQPTAFAATNDTISLGLDGASSLLTLTLADLPEASGSWVKGDPPATFTFDLGALGILDEVIALGVLDLRTQDDTMWDYARLHLEICRPKTQVTRRAGAPDAFALPTEPTRRSQALEDLRGRHGWRDFDQVGLDVHFGYTFPRLPASLCSASLEIIARPAGAGSGNDAVNLVIADGSFQSSNAFASLPESGGTWATASNGSTRFVLDLDALGLLDQIALGRSLDVHIQDDTVVDSLVLRLQTCERQSLLGTLVTEIGDSIAVPISPRSFEVFNFDAALDDGLAVDGGGAQGICLGVNMLCPGNSDSAIDLQIQGQVTTFTEAGITGMLSFLPSAPNVDLSAIFDPPFDTQALSVRISDDGMSVLYELGLANGAVVRVPEGACFSELDSLAHCFNLFLAADTLITVLGPGGVPGASATGDQITICRDIITGTKMRLDTFRFLGSNLPSLVVDRVQVQQFGQLHESFGNAALEPLDDGLVVSGLGASGEDGLRIDLSGSGAIDLELIRPDLAIDPAPGSALTCRTIGTLDRAPGQTLDTLTCTQIGPDSLSLVADFTALGAATQRVRVLSRGSEVAVHTGLPGTAVFASTWPHGLARLGRGVEGYASRHPAGTTFEIGGQVFVGDTVEILAENPGPIDAKESLELTTSGLSELFLTGELTLPEAIFADGFESGNISAWPSSVP